MQNLLRNFRWPPDFNAVLLQLCTSISSSWNYLILHNKQKFIFCLSVCLLVFNFLRSECWWNGIITAELSNCMYCWWYTFQYLLKQNVQHFLFRVSQIQSKIATFSTRIGCCRNCRPGFPNSNVRPKSKSEESKVKLFQRSEGLL